MPLYGRVPHRDSLALLKQAKGLHLMESQGFIKCMSLLRIADLP